MSTWRCPHPRGRKLKDLIALSTHAMPSPEKCKRSLELIKTVLTDVDLWFPMCHGTSTEFVKPIMDAGLEPRQCTEEGFCRPSNWKGDLESIPDRVYLGHAQSWQCGRAAARAESEGGGLGVILKIGDVPDEDRLVEDEDYVFRFDRLFKTVKKGDPLGGVIGQCGLENDYNSRKKVCPTSKDPDQCMRVAFEFIYSPESTVDREEFENTLFDMMESCDRKEILDFFNELPEWSKSLMTMRTLGYQGTIPPELISIEEKWQQRTGPKLVMEEVRRKTD